MACRLDAARGDGGLRRLEFAQDALTVLDEGRALRRQRQAAGGSLQQLDAQPRLERIQTATDHRRCDPLVAGGGGQAAALHDADEGRNLLEMVHS